MSIISWLESQGSQIVDAAKSEIVDVLSDFGKKCEQLETLYAKHYYLSEELGDAYPYGDYFSDLAASVSDERAKRLQLLTAFSAVGADPKEFGIPMVGLSENEIRNAYPGLVYDTDGVRVGLPIAVPIAALVLLAIAYAALEIADLLAEKASYDIYSALYEQYRADGMTDEEAAAAAKAKVKEINEMSEKGGIPAAISDVAGMVKIGVVAWTLVNFFGS